MEVAIFSLFGSFVVAGAAIWTNRSNNKAADQRRKDDQAAEDARRKADDDRRERERLEQLQREDWARQRKAVADCIRKMRETEAKRAAVPNNLQKLQILFEQYSVHLQDLDLEVTHPEVCKCLEEWSKTIVETDRSLRKYRSINGVKGWPEEIVVVKDVCPEALQRSAKAHLHFLYDYDQQKMKKPQR